MHGTARAALGEVQGRRTSAQRRCEQRGVSVNKRVHSYVVHAYGDSGRVSCVASVHGLELCTCRARGKHMGATEDFKVSEIGLFTQGFHHLM